MGCSCQNTKPMMQLVREAAALTTSYVPGDGPGSENDVYVGDANQVVLFLHVTKDALTSVDLKVEVKLTGQDLYQELAASVSGGTANLRPLEYAIDTSNLDDTHALYLPVPVLGDTVRISAKGNAAGGSLAIFAAAGRT